MRHLDDVDRTLLDLLAQDGRTTVRALAREIEMSEPAVRDRILRLERDDVIGGYHADLAPEAVGGGTAAYVSLRFGPDDAKAQVNTALEKERCVLEVHEVAGDDCYLVKVRVATTADLADTLDRLRAIPSVHSTSTTIVLKTIFERPLTVAFEPGD
ncbi:Lrp/AsnC family transcriptional regulator [Nocardioidaceae bacterium SCSIO 66511]|nr:Lrp/AsnC family transcriptional regulator [Nocardioidaceae bacterium SCSIO 66511]